jgi:NADPH:quinone reductase-like Zn-dependent oxidoreductase
VLIEVSACGMNNTDVWVRQGAYGTETDPDVGVDLARGRSTLSSPASRAPTPSAPSPRSARGAESRVGERVIVDFSIYNRPRATRASPTSTTSATAATAATPSTPTVPTENAHATDAAIDDAELATFCCAYLTGEHMLDRVRLAEGERILVTGASGGVGSGIIQLARARGAIPYAVTSAGKEQALLDIGAEAIVLREQGDLVEAVEQATGGQPVDVVADLVAGPMFNDLLRILKPEGRYTTSGAIAGPVVQLDLRTMYLKQLELHGSSQGTRTAFRRLVDYIERGTIKPLLHGTYPLSEFHRAQRTSWPSATSATSSSSRTRSGTRSERPMPYRQGERIRSLELIDTQSGGDVSRIVVGRRRPSCPAHRARAGALPRDPRRRAAAPAALRALRRPGDVGEPDRAASHPEAQAGYIIMEAMGYPLYSGSNTICTATACCRAARPDAGRPPGGGPGVPGGAGAGHRRVPRAGSSPSPPGGARLRRRARPDRGAAPLRRRSSTTPCGAVPSTRWSTPRPSASTWSARRRSRWRPSPTSSCAPCGRSSSRSTRTSATSGPLPFVHFMGPVERVGDDGFRSRTATYVHPGVICRSPTGTGTSARLARMASRAEIGDGQWLETISPRGTRFVGTVLGRGEGR